MRVAGLYYIFTLISLVGCVGLTNQSNAPTVSLSESTLSSADDCHYKEYKEKIAGYVESQCISCHAGNSGGLLLTAASGGATQANYSALITRIETSFTTADQTTLLRKITTGSGLNHSFQRSSSDPLVADYNTFVQNILSNPSCTAQNTGECLDDSCFF